MLEAMASGLPIIASRLPAHENLIDETTGRLVGDPDQFARAVEELEQPDLNLALGIHARDRARSIAGTWDDCAERFEALYRQLLQESGS
jgi:glycosyltransferase involved in cell wall biosynthesis